MTALATIIALSTASAPLPAHGPVTLRTGESVEIRIARTGQAEIQQAGPAETTDFDRASLRHLIRNHPDAIGPNVAPIEAGRDGVPEPAPVQRNRLKVKFVEYPPGDRALFIENGYGRALVYRARLRLGDKSAPTDVCLVIPRKRGVEHWPYRIDSIELSGFRLEKWKPSDGVRCE